MKLKLNTVKRIMRSSTSRPLATDAVVRMAILAEEFIKTITTEAEKELKSKNKFRKLQGLREKVRLSDEEIKEVIK